MAEVMKKERQAVALLRSLGPGPIEIAYSGGKDSDIMLALAQEAGINYRAIHKCTTIDEPLTLKHVAEVGAEIVRPKKTFLQLVQYHGMPTRRCRWCCRDLKEYPILDTCCIGVRAEESKARAERYQEPIQCRVYPHGQRVSVVTPLLNWTAEDEKEYIDTNQLRLHPRYYDEHGHVDISRRLGCIGCPLRGDRGKASFKEHPKMLRAWVRAAQIWWDRPRDRELRSREKFGSVINQLFHNLYARSYEDYLKRRERLGGDAAVKAFLEDEYGVSLDL